MNVLIACPIKDRSWAVPFWHKGITENQEAASISTVALLSPSSDGTEEALRAHDVEVIHDYEEGRTPEDIELHHWGPLDKFSYMARLRNRLVDLAVERDVDYLFSLDSDIVLPPYGLSNLLHYAKSHPGITSPAVNMAKDGVAWNVMNWTHSEYPGLVDRTKVAERGNADVVMAAMLLDRSALQCRWRTHLAGEDIGFCLDADSKGIKRWWNPEVRCQHLMRPVEMITGG